MKLTIMICTIFYFLYGSLTFAGNLTFENSDFQNTVKIPTKISFPKKGCFDNDVSYRKWPILLGEINHLLTLISKQHEANVKSVTAMKISIEMAAEVLKKAGGNALNSDRGNILLSSLKSDKYSQAVLLEGSNVNYLLVGYTITFQKKLGVILPGIVINLNNGVTEGTFKHKMGWTKGGGLCNGCWSSPNDACTACSTSDASRNKLTHNELWTYPVNEVLPLPLLP